METIDVYIEQRKIRWAGHVARKGPERPPCKFLTAWVRHPRPHGRPQYTFGHSLNKTLTRAGITTDFEGWRAMAQDREAWRAHIHGMAEYPPRPREAEAAAAAAAGEAAAAAEEEEEVGPT